MSGAPYDLNRVLSVYKGSDGDATKALYEALAKFGPQGVIALQLFRAQKNSERAKVYRGGGYRGAAYDRKQWAMENLCEALAGQLGIVWGWGVDEKQAFHNQVLYVDLPTGQVSFHTDKRAAGPDYPKTWDGVTGQSAQRICLWVARLFREAAPA